MEAIDKREAILNSTMTLIVGYGYHAVPMSKIAKEAGTGMGTIYHYFPTKDHIIEALFEEIVGKMGRYVLEGYTATEEISWRFDFYWRKMFEFAERNPESFLFLDQIRQIALFSGCDKMKSHPIMNVPLQILEDGQKQGIIRGGCPHLMAIFIKGGLTELIKSCHILPDLRMTGQTKSVFLDMAWSAVSNVSDTKAHFDKMATTMAQYQ